MHEGLTVERESAMARTVVLLGAGASKDAGLLLTSQLAAAVVQRANAQSTRPYRTDWVRAINAVYGGMVGHRGAQGEDPLSAVNIETLISAVRLLSARETHEVAPFVTTWAPSLTDFASSELPTNAGRALLDAVTKNMTGRHGFADRDAAKAVAQIARAELKPNLAQPFIDAEDFILSSLVELLGALESVTYLDPLIQLARQQPGGLDVITLNYDLSVETAAEQTGLTVNRGIETWTPGDELNFPAENGVLNLMKVHGSLDWRPSVKRDWRGPSPLDPKRIEVVAPQAIPQHRRHLQRDLPWIVVGDREKLATDGPTLALNFAARAAFRRASHLAVIGYSFADAHINAIVRDWLAADEKRTISILEPKWTWGIRDADDFRGALIRQHARRVENNGEPRRPRVALVEGTAAERLGDVLNARPAPAPNPLARASTTATDTAIRLDLTWHGDAMANVDLFATSAALGEDDPRSRDVPLLTSPPNEDVDADDKASSRMIPSVTSGETLTFFIALDTPLPLEVSIDGDTITGPQRWNGVSDAAA